MKVELLILQDEKNIVFERWRSNLKELFYLEGSLEFHITKLFMQNLW